MANGVECVENAYRLHSAWKKKKKKKQETWKMWENAHECANRFKIERFESTPAFANKNATANRTLELGLEPFSISHFLTRHAIFVVARVRPKKSRLIAITRGFGSCAIECKRQAANDSIPFPSATFFSMLFVRFDFECYQFGMHKCWRLHTTCRVRWHNNNDFSSTFNVLSIFIPLFYQHTVSSLL